MQPETIITNKIFLFVYCRQSNCRMSCLHSSVGVSHLCALELVNLAGRSGQAASVAAFREEVARRWSLASLHQQVLASQQRRHLVYAALRAGRHAPWDFQPLRDASRLYVRNDQELNDLEAMARFPPLAPRS